MSNVSFESFVNALKESSQNKDAITFLNDLLQTDPLQVQYFSTQFLLSAPIDSNPVSLKQALFLMTNIFRPSIKNDILAIEQNYQNLPPEVRDQIKSAFLKFFDSVDETVQDSAIVGLSLIISIEISKNLWKNIFVDINKMSGELKSVRYLATIKLMHRLLLTHVINPRIRNFKSSSELIYELCVNALQDQIEPPIEFCIIALKTLCLAIRVNRNFYFDFLNNYKKLLPFTFHYLSLSDPNLFSSSISLLKEIISGGRTPMETVLDNSIRPRLYSLLMNGISNSLNPLEASKDAQKIAFSALTFFKRIAILEKNYRIKDSAFSKEILSLPNFYENICTIISNIAYFQNLSDSECESYSLGYKARQTLCAISDSIGQPFLEQSEQLANSLISNFSNDSNITAGLCIYQIICETCYNYESLHNYLLKFITLSGSISNFCKSLCLNVIETILNQFSKSEKAFRENFVCDEELLNALSQLFTAFMTQAPVSLAIEGCKIFQSLMDIFSFQMNDSWLNYSYNSIMTLLSNVERRILSSPELINSLFLEEVYECYHHFISNLPASIDSTSALNDLLPQIIKQMQAQAFILQANTGESLAYKRLNCLSTIIIVIINRLGPEIASYGGQIIESLMPASNNGENVDIMNAIHFTLQNMGSEVIVFMDGLMVPIKNMIINNISSRTGINIIKDFLVGGGEAIIHQIPSFMELIQYVIKNPASSFLSIADAFQNVSLILDLIGPNFSLDILHEILVEINSIQGMIGRACYMEKIPFDKIDSIYMVARILRLYQSILQIFGISSKAQEFIQIYIQNPKEFEYSIYANLVKSNPLPSFDFVNSHKEQILDVLVQLKNYFYPDMISCLSYSEMNLFNENFVNYTLALILCLGPFFRKDVQKLTHIKFFEDILLNASNNDPSSIFLYEIYKNKF